MAYAVWAMAGLVAATILIYGLASGLGLAGIGFGGVGSAQNAPDFTLSLFSEFEGSSELRLEDLAGRPVLVNVWASWCGPCRAEMPAIERVWQRHRNRGLVVVGVTIQDREEDAKAFMAEVGVTYPVGLDADGSISRAYSIQGVPSTYFITDTGDLARAWVGVITEDRLESLTIDLLR
jgi:thiol-disulfide isomerase/thioredoxin